jgi:hypothetical protein
VLISASYRSNPAFSAAEQLVNEAYRRRCSPGVRGLHPWCSQGQTLICTRSSGRSTVVRSNRPSRPLSFSHYSLLTLRCPSSPGWMTGTHRFPAGGLCEFSIGPERGQSAAANRFDRLTNPPRSRCHNSRSYLELRIRLRIAFMFDSLRSTEPDQLSFYRTANWFTATWRIPPELA